MLAYKKVYVDSRYKTKSSKSDTDFTVEIPTGFTCPDNTVFYIDDIILPVSFLPINKRNNTMYTRLTYDDFVLTRSFTIAEASYSGTTFTDAIRNGLTDLYTDVPVTFTVTYDTFQNSIDIKFTDSRSIYLDEGAMTFTVETDEGITYWSNVSEITSINNIIKNNVKITIRATNAPDNIRQDLSKNVTFSQIDLHTTRAVYLHSSSLGNFNTLAVWGDDTIIKKIGVNAPFNGFVFDNVVAPMDFLNCDNQYIKRLDFKLTDTNGNVVDLRGNHWSFSIVFSLVKMDK